MLLSACSLPLSTDIRLTDATPIDYRSTHLHPPLSLAGWLAGWLIRACQIYDLCASLLACRMPLHYCNTV